MTNFPVPSYDAGRDLKETVRTAIQGIRLLFDGKHNATGEVTFTANASLTTIENARIGGNTTILLSPMTESAAGEVGYYPSYPARKGEIDIIHANDSRSDRQFRYVLQA